MTEHANDAYENPGSTTAAAPIPQHALPDELAKQQGADQGGTTSTAGHGGTAPEAAQDDDADLTVEDLKARAKAAGVEGYSSMRRDELLAALKS